MAIVTVSKGSFSRGEQVAEAVAKQLGYTCVAREELLSETSAEYDVPEARLVEAAYQSPSFWERMGSGGSRKYVAYIEAALLKRLRRDDVVYHGIAGQYFVRSVPHVLKVRVIANRDHRLGVVMEREKVDRQQAETILDNGDEERRRWSSHLYGIEVMDPTLYDIVLRVGDLSVETAVEVICQAAEMDRFKTTTESQQLIGDLAVAAAVRAALVEVKPDAVVRCAKGRVTIAIQAKVVHADAVAARVKKVASKVAGVREVEVKTEAAARVRGR